MLTVLWGISCSTQECPCQEQFGAIHQTLFEGSALGQLLALHPHPFLNPRERTERRDLSRACQVRSALLSPARSDKERTQPLDITEAKPRLGWDLLCLVGREN